MSFELKEILQLCLYASEWLQSQLVLECHLLWTCDKLMIQRIRIRNLIYLLHCILDYLWHLKGKTAHNKSQISCVETVTDVILMTVYLTSLCKELYWPESWARSVRRQRSSFSSYDPLTKPNCLTSSHPNCLSYLWEGSLWCAWLDSPSRWLWTLTRLSIYFPRLTWRAETQPWSNSVGFAKDRIKTLFFFFFFKESLLMNFVYGILYPNAAHFRSDEIPRKCIPFCKVLPCKELDCVCWGSDG